MAKYEFRANPADDADISTRLFTNTWTDRVIRGWSDSFKFEEHASGQLTISNLEDLEAEVVKRGLFSPAAVIKKGTKEAFHFVSLSGADQVAKLTELQKGTLTVGASLTRETGYSLTKKGKIPENATLGTPTIHSFAGNLAAVRSLMLDGIQEEFQKDGQADEGHFQEVATLADRMSNEIREEVDPQLLAVHAVTMEVVRQHLHSAQVFA